MGSTEKATRQSEAETKMQEIESKHFGQCIWQSMLPSRTVLIELMNFPKAGDGKTALVVKHYHRPIPKGGSGTWPEMIASYVYMPIDDSNTWDGLDKELAALHK